MSPDVSAIGGCDINGNISSPKTPSLTRSKFCSPCSSQPTSPKHTETKLNLFDSSSDFYNIRQVLEDESGKKLLQTCTMSLLYSRYLLCGNLVVIPIFSELCIFKIVGAEKVPEKVIMRILREIMVRFFSLKIYMDMLTLFW